MPSLPSLVREIKALAESQKRLGDLYRAAGQTNNAVNGQKAASGELRAGEKITNPGSIGQMADQQQKLAAEAARLEQKLRALAGKDPRVSHAYAQNMKRAQTAMGGAFGAVNRKDMNKATELAGHSQMELGQVIKGLELLQKRNAGVADVANEAYPEHFEELIAEYLRRLSHEE